MSNEFLGRFPLFYLDLCPNVDHHLSDVDDILITVSDYSLLDA